MISSDSSKGWTLPHPDYRDTESGELRVERFIGLWEGGPPGRWDPKGRLGRWSNLIDLRTGQVLLDASPFETSEFRWPEEGGLLFWMKRRSNEGMFRIDPGARTFRSLSSPGPAQPLSGLSAAVRADYDRMLLATPPGHCTRDGERPLRFETRFTPGGKVRLELLIWRSGKDDEEQAPRVVTTDGDRILLDFWPVWDCSHNLYKDQLFYLELLRTRFKATLNVQPDRDAVRISIASDGKLLPHFDNVPLDQVRAILEDHYKRHWEQHLAPLGHR